MCENHLAEVKDAKHLPNLLTEELEHFFLNVTLFMGKKVRIEGWRGAKFATNEVRRLRTPRN